LAVRHISILAAAMAVLAASEANAGCLQPVIWHRFRRMLFTAGLLIF
jgi:hypothetical protein